MPEPINHLLAAFSILLCWAGCIALLIFFLPYSPPAFFMAAIIFGFHPIGKKLVARKPKARSPLVSLTARLAGSTVGFLILVLTPISLMAVCNDLLKLIK